MNQYLVQNDLGKYRRGQRHELDRERGRQYIAPNGLVPEQLRYEPGKAEGSLARGDSIRVGERLGLLSEYHHFACIAKIEVLCAQRRAGGGARLDHHHAIGIGLDD